MRFGAAGVLWRTDTFSRLTAWLGAWPWGGTGAGVHRRVPPLRADAGTLASSITQGRTFWQPGLGDQYWAGKSWEVMLFSWARGFLCALSGLGPSEVPAKF